MSLFAGIRWTALRAFQPNSGHVWRQSGPQLSANGLNGWAKTFGTVSGDEANRLSDRPKRPQTSYNMFFKDRAAAIRQQNPSLNVKEVTLNVAQEWRQLDPNTKQELMEKSKKNFEQYSDAFKKWKDSLTDTQKEIHFSGLHTRKQLLARRRLRIELKRNDYPIRAKTAFNLYIQEAITNRPHSSEPFIDVFKKVVSKWKTMSPLEREPYVESAQNDKMRYLSEMEVWKEGIARAEKKDIFDRLVKLKAMASKVGFKYTIQTDKPTKKRKSLSMTTKSKTRAKPKSLKAKSKPKTAAKKSKSKTKPKSTAKSAKPKKTKKAEDSDSSD